MRIINLKPLLKEMNLEKGNVYTFFGRPVIGKTQLAAELTAHLLCDKDLRGIYLTSDKQETLAASVVKWENYRFLDCSGKAKYLFEENVYDDNKINAEIVKHNADFLVIDNVFQLDGEAGQGEFIAHLKEIAERNNIMIICTAPQSVRFDIGKNPRDLLKQAEETPVAKQLIHQSDFVAFMDCWAYFNVSYRGHFNDSMDFIIAKSNYKPTVVNIRHFREFRYPVGQFYPKNINEWKCAYCGERFVLRSANPNPAPPAETMRKCKSNPTSGKHLPIKII
ncbi:MAG: ATP-binding protein [Eubacterium sp.]|nr:ATP-binding protein [Eubacterium sp.]